MSAAVGAGDAGSAFGARRADGTDDAGSAGGTGGAGAREAAGRADAPPADDAPKPPIVLIHGAWAGSWVWHDTAAALEAAGYRVHAVDLPGVGCHPGDPAQATFDSHVAAVVAAVDAAAVGAAGDVVAGDVVAGDTAAVDAAGVDVPAVGRAVLVAHSGGGVIATAVAELMPQHIAGLVYVAGIMLPSGLTFAELCDELSVTSPDANGIIPYLEHVRLGSTRATVVPPDARVSATVAPPDAPDAGVSATVVPPDAGVAVFFNRAPAAQAVAAARRLGAWPDAVLSPVATHTPERFGTVPRVYVEAEFDRSIPLEVQRHMQQRTPGAARVTLPSDHAPQLSAPEQLLAGILSFVTTVHG